MKINSKDGEDRIITIPNILSLFRLLLVPVMIWLYRVEEAYSLTVAVLFLSALTDLADGFIARRFHMVSNVGKVLDPAADKFTQLGMLICLLSRYDLMRIPLVLLVVKEVLMTLTGYLVIRKTGNVYGADWHGKVSTTMLYVMMGLHLFWTNIPVVLSNGLILLCTVMMLISCVLYVKRNVHILVKKHA